MSISGLIAHLAAMSTAFAPPAVTSPSASSSTTLPPLSVLLSAPSLDSYISQLDEATLAQLYNQPPPLGSSPTSSSSTAVYSTPAAVDELKQIDATLAAAIDSAWKLSLHLDAGPDSTPSVATSSRSTLSLHSSVSSFLSSLASVDSAARRCELLVPQSLLEQVDDGRNPERGLADLMDQLIANNDRARGRAIATHSLRECMETYVQVAKVKETEAQQQSQSKRETTSAMSAMSE